jgi:hypothetical protein
MTEGSTSVRMRRSDIRWLVALGALGCVAMVSVISPAPGYTDTLPPWFICFGASNANLKGLEASLNPANGATVQTGTPVTFSGNSSAPVTFAVASSSALLSSPDIDGGPGSLQPGTSSYTFTSTKATATPGTVYWDASFSDATLAECAGESSTTFTTQVRTLTVLPAPSPPTTMVTPATAPATPPAAIGSVSKPKVKSLTRTQRLAAALKACHKKGRKQRVVCERQARNQFGRAKKTNKK